jgi:hypothetical protein
MSQRHGRPCCRRHLGVEEPEPPLEPPDEPEPELPDEPEPLDEPELSLLAGAAGALGVDGDDDDELLLPPEDAPSPPFLGAEE